ncbi:MAG: hypothetical protein LAT61_09965 [Alcanivorax sp.]|nr:hypothetical protein [Alcanivorax sp.]
MPIKILVSDTNIWIDLHRANILSAAFQLPYEFVVTDFVYRELRAPQPNSLIELGLRVESLGADSIIELTHLRVELGNTSLADLSCFHLAASNKWTLLTGDKAVRAACQIHGVEVRGVIWILDQLFAEKVLDGEDLAIALQTMLDRGARLPQAECDKRLRLWRLTPRGR